jgi:hypothetical protein
MYILLTPTQLIVNVRFGEIYIRFKLKYISGKLHRNEIMVSDNNILL